MPVRKSVLFLLVVTVLGATSATSSTAQDQGHSATREAMERLVRQQGLPGVLARVEDGDGVWWGQAGVADRGLRTPRRPQERFRIGSVTKTFVAVTVLRLVAERRLRLEDPVERWLPGVLRHPGYDGRRITVRRLLQHGSGIPDFTGTPEFRARLAAPAPEARRDRDARQWVDAALRRPPRFAPGNDREYSNTNYLLAGMVVERVTGHRWDEEVRRLVVRPLALEGTSIPLALEGVPVPHATAYSRRGGGGAPGTRELDRLSPTLAGASGEMISTAGDLLRFYRALLGGELLPPEQLRQMLDAAATDPEGYGLGVFALRLSCDRTVWGHRGDILGSHTLVATTQDAVHGAVFQVNGDWARHTERLLEAEFCP
ncbi:serine hydrolase domain-containing protein [Streptomyces sp. NPDC005438]|uniref:serine hydrolase domain-containing protein n=1 Tax=Streptomyces sp. NPDC005438 TaxID=3156880 RepID=UPI0033BD7293